MICRTCLRAASRTHTQPTRFLTTSSRLRDATLQSTSIPPATSSSDAQPFSSPLTPSASPGIKAQATEAAKKKPTPLVKSSIAAGTPLKGLNFEKNKTDPVALPDDEYPEWLWTILQRQEKDAEGAGAGDLFSKSKKQRRVAAKRLRKEQAMNPGMLEPKIPIYEQTVDLPVGDGSLDGAVQASAARDELTKAMREKRRATIKEANFLKAMG